MAKSAIQKIAKDVEKKVKVAANRAARKTRTEVVKYIRQYYNIKASVLRDSIKIKYAVTSNGVTNVKLVSTTKKPYGLIHFSARQTKRPKKYKTGKVGGTKVTVRRGKRELMEHAFIKTSKAGKQGVFIRTTEKSYPVKELYGPTPTQLFGMIGAQKHMEKVFFKEFDKEFDRLMKL